MSSIANRTVICSRQLEQDLITACRKRLPYEACGIVYGNVAERMIHADSFAMLRNASPTPENRFTFDPDEWIAACYEAQKNQRLIVGLFHSHPNGTDVPSAHDAKEHVPWASYWIVSLGNEQDAVNVYQRDARHRFVALPMVRESG